MDDIRMKPGPAAGYAFRLGIVAAVLLGLAGIGLLYWSGILTSALAGYTLVVLFPIYLVLAATVLSIWLGYDKDETSLRPVYHSKNSK